MTSDSTLDFLISKAIKPKDVKEKQSVSFLAIERLNHAETKSVITNAIYFRALWSGELSKQKDKLDFSKPDGSKIQVDALGDAGHFPYTKEKDFQAVVESLREDAFKVMFILPDEGKFDSVMASMDGEKVLGIFDSLTRKTNIHLTFPIYEFTTELSLSDTLKSLGMVKAFHLLELMRKVLKQPQQQSWFNRVRPISPKNRLI